MSNNEPKQFGKDSDKSVVSPKQAQKKVDLYDELIKEGKEVLDNIPEAHNIHDDPFQMPKPSQVGPVSGGEKGQQG